MRRYLQWPIGWSASLLVVIVVATVAAAEDSDQTSPIALPAHPQLFLDDYLIAQSSNIQQTLNPPKKHLENPLPFDPEYPWEMARMDPGCVIYDNQTQRFRMWYTVLMDKARYADNYGYVCYAESEDGIHWRKPMLDIHDFEGQRLTNIVFKGPTRTGGECLFPSIIYTPKDTRRPYKMLFTHRRSPENPAHYGLHTATSPDGLHWEEPVLIFQGKCDNPPSLIWSERLNKFLGYCRAQDSHPDMVGHIRATGILESKDFGAWTPRKKVVLTDERDGYPFTQFHHITVTEYGDLLIGMADVMHMMGDDNKTSTEDIQLISSRDGWNWQRVADRTVFIPNGPEPYDQEIAAPRSPIVRKDDTLYIFYQGSSLGQRPAGTPGNTHGPEDTRTRGGLCLATLPADRFVALQQASPDSPGILETRPFTTTAQDLVINAEIANTASIQVEVLDADGEVLQGFKRTASQLTPHDSLRYKVTWGPQDSLKNLADATRNGAIAFRFILNGGALYAFQSAAP